MKKNEGRSLIAKRILCDAFTDHKISCPDAIDAMTTLIVDICVVQKIPKKIFVSLVDRTKDFGLEEYEKMGLE